MWYEMAFFHYPFDNHAIWNVLISMQAEEVWIYKRWPNMYMRGGSPQNKRGMYNTQYCLEKALTHNQCKEKRAFLQRFSKKNIVTF